MPETSWDFGTVQNANLAAEPIEQHRPGLAGAGCIISAKKGGAASFAHGGRRRTIRGEAHDGRGQPGRIILANHDARLVLLEHAGDLRIGVSDEEPRTCRGHDSKELAGNDQTFHAFAQRDEVGIARAQALGQLLPGHVVKVRRVREGVFLDEGLDLGAALAPRRRR